MVKYFQALSSEQYNNISIFIARCIEKGITNKKFISAMLAVLSKEGSFRPSFERGYAKTSNERIRAIFSSTRDLPEQVLNSLKADEKRFFNFVYGGKFGNRPNTDDGYRYRGAGHNQITFRANYQQAKEDSLVDVVSNPERINEPMVASDAAIGYFMRRFKAKGIDVNAYTDLNQALNDVYQANAGKLGQKVTSDPTGGLAVASGRAAGFYEYVLKHSGESASFLKVKANLYKYYWVYIIIFLLVISLILWYVLKNK